MRKYMPTVVVFVLFVGLLIYVVLSGGEKSKPQKQAIFSADKTDVVSIQYDSSTSMLFKKVNDKYGLFIPEEVPSNTEKISDFVDKCSNIEYEAVVAKNEQNLSQFGLSQPKKIVTINKKDGTKFELFIGNKTPTQEAMYVKDSKNNVYTVNMDIASIFEQNVNDFLNKKLISFDETKIDKVFVKYKKDMVFEKVNGNWMYKGKIIKLEEISELTDQLKNMVVDGLLEKEKYIDTSKTPDIGIAMYQNGQIVSRVVAYKYNQNYIITKQGLKAQYYLTKDSMDNYVADASNIIK